jgi:hypothetical protein
MSVTTYSKNIFETGTGSLTAGAAHADYPLARIWDRNISDIFKTTAAVTTEIQADQGASGNIALDTCIIASGHNLAGELIDIQHSPDGAVWTNGIAQFAGTAGNIIKTLTGGTKRYWRVKITSPSNAVEIPEIFFTPAYAWEADPVYPLDRLHDRHNVKKMTDAKGENYYLKLGTEKRVRPYNLMNMLAAQKDNLLDLWADWDGYKPFYITDHEGNLIFVEIADNDLTLSSDLKGIFAARLNLEEVLNG